MNAVHFGVHQDQNFYKLDCQFLLKVAKHVQSTQKRKFVKFLQCIATVFAFYYDAKHSDTLRGSSHVCCYLFLEMFVRNGYGLLDHASLKSTVSQKSELIK